MNFKIMFISVAIIWVIVFIVAIVYTKYLKTKYSKEKLFVIHEEEKCAFCWHKDRLPDDTPCCGCKNRPGAYDFFLADKNIEHKKSSETDVPYPYIDTKFETVKEKNHEN